MKLKSSFQPKATQHCWQSIGDPALCNSKPLSNICGIKTVSPINDNYLFHGAILRFSALAHSIAGASAGSSAATAAMWGFIFLRALTTVE